MMTLTHGTLHATIAGHFMDHGSAPTIAQLSAQLALDRETVANALQALAEYHGVVLHPTSREIWAMHPFSAAPTSFWVESKGRGWWGNCAWCALGIAALLQADATITTTSSPSRGLKDRPNRPLRHHLVHMGSILPDVFLA